MSGKPQLIITNRLKIDRIKDRLDKTVLPNIDEFWLQKDDLDLEMSRLMVDRMIFSTFPNAQQDGAAALSAFLMNTKNRDGLKNAGSFGAVIEMLWRADISKNSNSAHISNLVKSLYILTDGDKIMLERLLNNEHGIAVVNGLCKYCSGKNQYLAMEVMKFITEMPDQQGMAAMLRGGSLEVLMSPELLFHHSTSVSVRHTACNLVHKLAQFAPLLFPWRKFVEYAIDSDGKRRIDGYMEVQLLQSFICHLTALKEKYETLPEVFSLFAHLIDEIKSETFDSLDHMQHILRCCVMVSEDPKQVDYMLNNGLGVALQYLVRTDFMLFRRKTNSLESINSVRDSTSTQSSLKNQQQRVRTKGTLIALSTVMPDNGKGRGNRQNDEINLFTTTSALTIFENIMLLTIEVVSDIVSSGIVPALMFRVGRGVDKDRRFLKLFVHFMYRMLSQVMMCQPEGRDHISMISDLRANATSRKGGGATYCGMGRTAGAEELNKGGGGGSGTGAKNNSTPGNSNSKPTKNGADSSSGSSSKAAAAAAGNSSSSSSSSKAKGGAAGAGGGNKKSTTNSNNNSSKEMILTDEEEALRIRRAAAIDFRAISKSLHAQGVTGLFFFSLRNSDDHSVISESIHCLSFMQFSVIHEEAYKVDNMTKLFHLCFSREECFFPALSIAMDMILFNEVEDRILFDIVDTKGVKVLIRALRLSGWVFKDKDLVYFCLSKLAKFPNFQTRLLDCGGISVVVSEVRLRRARYKKLTRKERAQLDDDGTDVLFEALRPDVAAAQVQAVVRGWIGRHRTKHTTSYYD